MSELHLTCDCRSVVAAVQNISSRTSNRVVCYCSDCQAFARHLGRVDVMDESAVLF
ncbi:DUF6151 family protein [Veronia pacifica]|uniref:DUF6151 family protein n=1 Tax=Veronia pacifica TaxID=1080227 RepID=UPI000B0872AF|nr:DUF6151 family protein [Veronia pacifica]